MKAMLFYRPNSEHERMVIDYLREFQRRTAKELPTVDVDSKEGIELCQLYGVMKYPMIIAVNDDGQELQRWEGELLPQISEVSYYIDS